MGEIIAKIIPILLLISFGYWIQRKKLLQQSTVNEVKKGVINVSLPALLFLTFINMELRKEYFFIIVLIFVLMIVLYFVGQLVNRIPKLAHPLNPFFTSGFTFGLLGIPLYSTVFGVENLEKISLFGIGHELFIWFIYYTLLKVKFSDEKFSISELKGFLKSPLIIAVVAGLALNVTGGSRWFYENSLLRGVYTMLDYLGILATPLILMIIGFGLKFDRQYMRQSIQFVITRLVVILTVGYLFKLLLIDRIMPMGPLFEYAYFTFLILPPPFSLAIFVGEYSTEEHKNLINNSVVLYTVVSISIYILFVFFV